MRRSMMVMALSAGLLGSSAAAASAETFTVNDLGDLSDSALADAPNACDTAPAAGDQCTLRAAIEEANNTSGLDVIAFAVPGAGVGVIAPATDLPVISEAATIDGYTQPGAAENTAPLDEGTNATLKVMLSGENLSPSFSTGLTTGPGAAGSEVRGLIINRFATGILTKGETTIAGNFIGTDATGQGALGNSFDAIFGFSGDPSLVGGPDRADRNLLSGNDRAAVTTSTVMTIQGNLIGVAADGATALGNAGDGIGLYNPTGGYVISRNVIAFNAIDGIVVHNSSSGSAFGENRIFSNAALGIDLSGDGPTANDPGDPDVGPNELQNFPRLTSARSSKERTRIKGTLDSLPGETFEIEFFSNPPGTDQARKPIGTRTVGTGTDGTASFGFVPRRRVAPTRTITATATNQLQSTSEISAPRKVKKKKKRR